jgi:segregation and condensation protein B
VEGQPIARIAAALLFVAEGPVSPAQLAQALDIAEADLESGLAAVEAWLREGGLSLQRQGGKLQIVTAPDLAPHVERFLGLDLSGRLSPAALEVLAIIAYRQPITRALIESIRGVNCDGVLRTLSTKGLVTEVGRLEQAGRPILYGTTFEFLQHFGLQEVRDLPPLSPATGMPLHD